MISTQSRFGRDRVHRNDRLWYCARSIGYNREPWDWDCNPRIEFVLVTIPHQDT